MSSIGPTNIIRVLFLAETLGIGAATLRCLDSPNLHVEVIGTTNSSALRFSTICRRFHKANFHPWDVDSLALLNVINTLSEERNADVILIEGGGLTAPFSKISGQLNTAYAAISSTNICQSLDDKWRFYLLCQEFSLPTPKTILFRNKSDFSASQISQELGWPVVLKPTYLGGGIGVKKIEDEDHLKEVSLDKDYKFQPLIVQEFIDGLDIDISFYAENGEIMNHAVQIRPGREFVFTQNQALEDVVRKLVLKTDFNGVAHIDARICKHDGLIKLVECNPRFWSSVGAARECGLNFPYLQIQRALRLADPPQPATIVENVYMPPLHALYSYLRLDFSAAAICAPTRCGVIRFLKDPVPAIVNQTTRVIRHLGKKRR